MDEHVVWKVLEVREVLGALIIVAGYPRASSVRNGG